MNEKSEFVTELWEHLESCPFVMVDVPAQDAHAEPMVAFTAPKDHPESLFFFTHRDNRIVQAVIAGVDWASATFASERHDFFASLRGTLHLSGDAALIDRFWTAEVNSWFEGGKSDPMLQLIELRVDDAELWKVNRSLRQRMQQIFGGPVSLPTASDLQVARRG